MPDLNAVARDIDENFSSVPVGTTVQECMSATKSAGEDSKTKDNRIDIVFDPDNSTKVTSCDKIVHVQFIRITVDGTVTKPGDFVGAFKYRDAVMTKDGWWIDHLQKETTPDYQQGTGNGRKTSSGSQKASIVDVPNIGDDTVLGPYDATTNPGGWKTVHFEFQTFAWCMQGTDCGKWYEGVTWQYDKSAAQQKAGQTGASTILDKNVSPPPSAGQIEAFDLFNKKKGFKPCS